MILQWQGKGYFDGSTAAKAVKPTPPDTSIRCWEKDHDDTKYWQVTQLTYCFDVKGKLTHTEKLVQSERSIPGMV